MTKQSFKNANDIRSIRFKFLSISNFTDFLKRFMVVDSNALLELRTDNTLVIKTYTAARTAVKYGVLKLEDVFDFDPDSDSVVENIKIGIYNIERLVKTISMYSEKDDVTFDLQYELDSDGDLFGKSIITNNGILEITFDCAQKSLFKFMPDDILKTVFNTERTSFLFKLDTTTLKLVEGVSALEANTDLELEIHKDGSDEYYLQISGKNFSYKFTGDVDVLTGEEKIIISKEYLKYLDKETYNVVAIDTSLLLFSDDSETKISFGRVLSNDDE